MGEKRNTYTLLLGNVKERGGLENLDVDVRVIKWEDLWG
jgi:hypothetical protein